MAFGSSTSQRDGRLRIRNNIEVYLRDGRLDEDRMLRAFEEMVASARSADGFGACMTTSSFAPIIWNSFAGMPCSTSCGRTRWSLLEGISNKTLIHAPRPDSCTQRSFSGNFGDGGLEEQIPSDGGPIWTINQGTQRLKSNAYSAV
jgi:hypothetical protein